MAHFSFFRFWILSLLTLLFAVGCTDERQPLERSAPEIESYELLSQVPACTPSRVAQVYYVQSEDKFYFCDGTTLHPIDLSGDDGVSWLIMTSEAEPGDCPNGGVVIETGPDDDSDGVLDDGEVRSSETLCNGSASSTPPTVTIDQAAAQPDPTNVSPVVFSVQYSEQVAGFTGSDVAFTGSTIGGTLLATVSGSGASYTVSVSGMNGVGTVVVSIPTGAATDLDGTLNTASTSTDNTVTFDNVGPTVTINQAIGQPDPTTVSPIEYTVMFSEAVAGFDGSDISFAGSTVGGTLVANVSGTGATYTVTVTGVVGNGIVVATIPAGAAVDLGGSASQASTSTDNTVSSIDVAPTVTINQASGQPDPTTAASIEYTVVFSEAVAGFDGSDISFAASTVGGTLVANVSGTGAIYTVTVTGMVGNGVVVANVPFGVAVDSGGGASQASTSTDNTVTFIDVAPTVTIDQASGQPDPTNASSIEFTVVFSEPVVGFSGADISFTASTVGGTLVATVSGSGANYTVSVTGMAGTGNVIASIPFGAATDASGNSSSASTSSDNTVLFAP